jgi:hypothetical protein
MRTAIVVVLVLAVCAPTAFARTWTDSTGNYTVEAELVDFEDGKVHLKKGDGTIVSVPIEKLSNVDQAYVRGEQNTAPSKKEQQPIPSTQLEVSSRHPAINASKIASQKPRNEHNKGTPIPWGSRDAKNRGSYRIEEITVDYENGVNLRLKYKRAGSTADKDVDKKGGLGIMVHFVRGAKDIGSLPKIEGAEQEFLNMFGSWTYMGNALVDPKTKTEAGAFAFMKPPSTLPEDGGEVTVPVAATRDIPLHGDGVIVVMIADYVSWKRKSGVGFRQLSDAMALPIHLPAKN